MTRYVRQPRRYSCGPTAIINAVKWAGFRCSVRGHHDLIAALCDATYEYGTEEHDFERVLRRMLGHSITVRKRVRPTITMLEQHMTGPDRAAILLYWYPSRGYHVYRNRYAVEGHYALLTKLDRATATIINGDTTATVSKIIRPSLCRRLSFKRRSTVTVPQVWLLRRV